MVNAEFKTVKKQASVALRPQGFSFQS